MKPTITWILIADGAHGRILAHSGHGLEPVPGMEFAAANLPGRDIVSDRPGRAFDSAGAGRHAMEPPTDPRHHAKRVFADSLAAVLANAKRRGAFDRLIVVAPPKALGDLRDALSADVKAAVVGELAKDLTHTPLDRLPEHLGGVLAV